MKRLGDNMEALKRMDYTPQNRPIAGLLSDIEDGYIDLEPNYQRCFVWNETMQKELIYSVMFKNPIGTLTLWEKNQEDKKITDGLQRLTTLRKFFKDELYVDGKIAKKILQLNLPIIDKVLENNENPAEVKKAKKLQRIFIQKNPRLYYSDFTEKMKQYFKDFEIPVMNIRYATEKDIRDYFRRIQLQEKLKAGEIINSIDSNVLQKIMEQINDLKALKVKLGFAQDKRREFEKVYYSLIGILEGKFTLGVLDKKIIKYVEELDERADEFYSNTDLQDKISKLNNNFNDITELSTNIEIGRSDLKFLIFQCANDFYGLKQTYGLQDIIEAFGIVCNRFRAFYSYKPLEEAKKDYFTEEMLANKNLMDDYQSVSILRRSSHKLDSFEEKMETMRNLIEYEITNKVK